MRFATGVLVGLVIGGFLAVPEHQRAEKYRTAAHEAIELLGELAAYSVTLRKRLTDKDPVCSISSDYPFNIVK